jgi:serine protease Do
VLADAAEANPEASDDGASGLAKLGLELEPAKGGGVKIVAVAPDSAAFERGLEAGDVIVDAGGKEVSQPTEIAAAIDGAKTAGHKSVLLRVKSNQSVRFVALPVKKAS